ncbi:MAG: hypothetical protein QXI89_00070 [Candidatus Anstonellales archaeon]
MKKAQAAIEFLMTYGWAIFVILIVLGALVFYLTRFRSSGEFCLADQGFTCSDLIATTKISGTDRSVNVSFRFINQKDKAINLINITCVRSEFTGNEPFSSIKDVVSSGLQPGVSTVQLSPGQTIELKNVPCYEQGTKTRLQMGQNQDFQGVVIIKYNFTTDFVESRIARVSFKVLTTGVQ